MNYLFETPSAWIRMLEYADFDQVYSLLSDPTTMRYIRAPMTEHAQLEERMEVWLKYAEQCPGLGSFILIMKDSGRFGGICVGRQVDYDPRHEEYEIGYILAENQRGRGLASEIVPYLCRYTFEQSKAAYLVAFTDPENQASQRVLIKSGFEKVGERLYEGDPSFIFHLHASAALL